MAGSVRGRLIATAKNVALPPDPRDSILSLQLKLTEDHTRYTHSQLLQLRRQMLPYARSLPRGSSERNERRQIASSLRSLFRDKKWMDVHSVEGSP